MAFLRSCAHMNQSSTLQEQYMHMAKSKSAWIQVPGGAVPDWFDGKNCPDAFKRFEECRKIFLEGFERVESQWAKSRHVFIDTGRTKIPRVSTAFTTAANQIYHM